MEMGRPEQVRIALIVLNSTHLAIACCLIGLGIYLKADADALVRIIKDVKHPASHYYEAYGTIAITVGSAITNMGYLTLGGVIMRNRCMLYLYMNIVLLLALCEIIGVALGAVYVRELPSLLNERGEVFYRYQADFEEQISNNSVTNEAKFVYKNGEEERSRSLDFLQLRYECCGIDGIDDFASTQVFPVTCCPLGRDVKETAKCIKENCPITILTIKDKHCPYNWTGPVEHVKGCREEFVDLINRTALSLFIVYPIHIPLQLIIAVLMAYLAWKSPVPIPCPCCPPKKTEGNTEMQPRTSNNALKDRGYKPTSNSNKPWWLRV